MSGAGGATGGSSRRGRAARASIGIVPSPALEPEPMLLVCTHGVHDTCCAVRGRPVAAALARRWPEATWECSHVGGDRFAAQRARPARRGLLRQSRSGRGACRRSRLIWRVDWSATTCGASLGTPRSPRRRSATAHARWGPLRRRRRRGDRNRAASPPTGGRSICVSPRAAGRLRLTVRTSRATERPADLPRCRRRRRRSPTP